MTKDNDRSMTASASSNSTSDSPGSVPKKRLEDLLIEEASPKTTFRDIADQEVKSGKRVGSSLRWPFAIFALLIVAMVGVVGWYQFGDLLTGQPGAQDPVRVEKRMAVPERPQLLATARQGSEDAAREAVPGDGSAATEIAEQEVAGVAADAVTKGVDDKTAVLLTDLPATSAAAPGATPDEVVESVPIASAALISEEQQVATGLPVAVVAGPVHRVLVGPFISQRELERATSLLRERGFQPEQQPGSGTVDMIRLLEGIYPLEQARQRLEELRKEFTSAFLLPDGDRWALYIGSFSDRERARRQQRDLAERQIQVVQVDSQLTMEGPVLVVVRSGLQAAEEVAAEVNASGLRARIEIER